MFINHKKTLEQKIEQQNEKLRLLEQKLARTKQEIAEFTKDSGLDWDKLAAYASDPQNFSSEEWERLSEQRQKHEEALERDLGSLKDPLSANAARQELARRGRNWIPI